MGRAVGMGRCVQCWAAWIREAVMQGHDGLTPWFLVGGAGDSGAGSRSGCELGPGERRAELELTNKGADSSLGAGRGGRSSEEFAEGEASPRWVDGVGAAYVGGLVWLCVGRGLVNGRLRGRCVVGQGICRKPQQCKERHKALTERAGSEGLENTEDPSSSQAQASKVSSRRWGMWRAVNVCVAPARGVGERGGRGVWWR